MMSKVETNLADYSHAGTTFEAHVAHTGKVRQRGKNLAALLRRVCRVRYVGEAVN